MLSLLYKHYRGLDKHGYGFSNEPKVRSGLIAIILAVGTSSLFYLKSNDDIRNLQGMDASLKLQDQAVREQFGQQQSSDYFGACSIGK